MRHYVRILGHTGEPVVPAQEILLDEKFTGMVRVTSTVTTIVVRCEVYNSEGTRLMTHSFDNPLALATGSELRLNIFLRPH